MMMMMKWCEMIELSVGETSRETA